MIKKKKDAAYPKELFLLLKRRGSRVNALFCKHKIFGGKSVRPHKWVGHSHEGCVFTRMLPSWHSPVWWQICVGKVAAETKQEIDTKKEMYFLSL